MNRKYRWGAALLALLLLLTALFVGCEKEPPRPSSSNGVWDNIYAGKESQAETENSQTAGGYASVPGIPDYSGKPYAVLNDNNPRFAHEELKTESYEFYSELDALGRCGETRACVGRDIMPTEERESISSVKPSGWINKKYDTELVDGGYLYNRCHLIGFQLTGENANEQNLITGTRYMNVDGMLPFENMIADYVKETGNHVMYRVTPIFVGDNLVASGCRLEAYSVEDSGDGVCFHVFVYNVQPGITIDYKTGDNWLNGAYVPPADSETANSEAEGGEQDYVLNTSSKKFHRPTCSGAQSMNENNRLEVKATRQSLIDQNYDPCGSCHP